MGLIKLNGVDYWGSNYGAGILAPMIYSDEEREVGVWRDNKPLYQKTIYFNNLNVGSTSVAIGTIANLDTYVEGTGSVKEGSLSYSIAEHGVRIRAEDNGEVTLRALGGASWVNISGAVNVRYTKTTDVAGSGNWNTDGIPTHHYSTNEQVIGTWIDRKPLYECTIDGLSLLANASWTAEVATNLNIKYLVNATLYDNSNPTNPIIVNVDQVQVLNGGFRISHSYNSGRTITMAVIQYTKTTD